MNRPRRLILILNEVVRDNFAHWSAYKQLVSVVRGLISSKVGCFDLTIAPSIRVGSQFQAVIPEYCLSKPAPADYDEKALLVWKPNNDIDEEKCK